MKVCFVHFFGKDNVVSNGSSLSIYETVGGKKIEFDQSMRCCVSWFNEVFARAAIAFRISGHMTRWLFLHRFNGRMGLWYIRDSRMF